MGQNRSLSTLAHGFPLQKSRPNEEGYRMALPDGLPDRKALRVFKAIYLLKDEIFV
jgi:hypothetical protein